MKWIVRYWAVTLVVAGTSLGAMAGFDVATAMSRHFHNMQVLQSAKELTEIKQAISKITDVFEITPWRAHMRWYAARFSRPAAWLGTLGLAFALYSGLKRRRQLDLNHILAWRPKWPEIVALILILLGPTMVLSGSASVHTAGERSLQEMQLMKHTDTEDLKGRDMAQRRAFLDAAMARTNENKRRLEFAIWTIAFGFAFWGIGAVMAWRRISALPT